MRRNINTGYILLAVLFLCLFVSCDQVTSNYYESAPKWPSAGRKILLMDFTGAKCVNCPAAHEEAQRLIDSTKGRLIVIAVHSGYYAKPDTKPPYNYNFQTEVGKELDESEYKVSAYPSGLINMKAFVKDKPLLPVNSWSTYISTMRFDSQQVAINIDPSYNSSDSTITVKVNLTYMVPGSNYDNLAVYIVEDSIVHAQKDSRKTPPDVLDYVHNNVLRASMNGTWGEQITASANVYKGSSFTKEYTLKIPSDSDWRPDKLRIIAFVFDSRKEVREVWDVEQSKLIK